MNINHTEDALLRLMTINHGMVHHPSFSVAQKKVDLMGPTFLHKKFHYIQYAMRLERAAMRIVGKPEGMSLQETYQSFGRWITTQVVNYCNEGEYPRVDTACTELRVEMVLFFTQLSGNNTKLENELIEVFHTIPEPHIKE